MFCWQVGFSVHVRVGVSVLGLQLNDYYIVD